MRKKKWLVFWHKQYEGQEENWGFIKGHKKYMTKIKVWEVTDASIVEVYTEEGASPEEVNRAW